MGYWKYRNHPTSRCGVTRAIPRRLLEIDPQRHAGEKVWGWSEKKESGDVKKQCVEQHGVWCLFEVMALTQRPEDQKRKEG